MSHFTFKDGKPSKYPIGRDEAVRLGFDRYCTEEKCDHCYQSHTRFTKTMNCIMCVRYIAEATQAVAKEGPDVLDSSGYDGCLTYHAIGYDFTLTPAMQDQVNTGVIAIATGAARFHDQPCRLGHPGLVMASSKGKCWWCATRVSPRQKAVRDGEMFYTPDTPCKHCHTLAPRRVNNGQCTSDACSPEKEQDGRETADSLMMKECPDLVISKDQAAALGYKVYRTGEPCRRNHTGYRYVSTGNCIECLRGDNGQL